MAGTKKRQAGKLSGLNSDGSPNAHWKKFKERLDNYNDTAIENWTHEHILGHILKRYKDQVGTDFSLSHSGPPTKCKELYCTRRLVLALGTEDPIIIKKYIDWVYDTIIIPGKVLVSSIAYFFTINMILKFKQEQRKQARISRATKLPENYLNIVQEMSLDVKTYGDLAFAKMALENSPENEDLAIYLQLFNALKVIGFNENILGKLEG